MSFVQSDPDILGGTPVFAGTRVPVQALTDYLEAGDDLEAFLDDFPTVDAIQATEAMTLLRDDTLWRLAATRVPEKDAARLSDLADRRQREGISADELREAEALVAQLDRVMLVRAQAAALLEQRGHDVSHLGSRR